MTTRLDDLEALEALYGRPMPEDLRAALSPDRPQAIAPAPRDLIARERPFEALVLQVQACNDTVSLLFPLTDSVWVRSVGQADLVGYLPPDPTRGTVPFMGWANDGWAEDLPTVEPLFQAWDAWFQGNRMGAEAMLTPVWGLLHETGYTEELFAELHYAGAAARLDAAWGDRPRVDPAAVALVALHKRALFLAFALGVGKFAHFDPAQLERTFQEARRDPNLHSGPAQGLYWLWRSWLLSEDAALDEVLEATADAPALLVQDARALIGELRAGRTHVGTLDYQALRERITRYARDPEAAPRDARDARREALERELAPSPHGIALVRATWPLERPPVQPEPVRPIDRSSLVAPPPEVASADVQRAAAAASPDGSQVLLQGHALRIESKQQAPALLLCDAGAWRVRTWFADLQWARWVADGRWLVADREVVYLLQDDGQRIADYPHRAVVQQPHRAELPGLDALVVYGSSDLANGRPLDDRGSPRVRVIAWWRDGLAEVASFAVDGVELVLDGEGQDARVGLISTDRSVAWELVGLREGIAAWREASEAALEAERARWAAAGEITVERVVEVLNALTGAAYGEDEQAHYTKAFDEALDDARRDQAVLEAARTAPAWDHFTPHFKGLFAKRLLAGDPSVIGFALNLTTLRADMAEIGVRAAVEGAWKALRE